MAILRRLEEYLKRNNIHFHTVMHPEAYTSQEIAAAMHVRGKELAKTVIVKADGHYVMTVLPANRRVDLGKLKEVLQKDNIRLADEDEFEDLFPDCEPGAEPPFGNLYNVETLVDRTLTEDDHIFFNAGNHYEAVEMGYDDYKKLVKPKVADFGMQG